MTHLPLWVLHSEMGIEQNKWRSNGCSIPNGHFELDSARTRDQVANRRRRSLMRGGWHSIARSE
jgi:hypothetical protein